ncbi:Uncharacterised protein [Prevotella disiens]|uniref:Uncharacterized protein n=1 Tax=Prevotella disiens TaxID=28130 RepID=A0A379EG24_9BACT|nr:Uncharacterised protein [Prevotella disiens]
MNIYQLVAQFSLKVSDTGVSFIMLATFTIVNFTAQNGFINIQINAIRL